MKELRTYVILQVVLNLLLVAYQPFKNLTELLTIQIQSSDKVLPL